MPSRHSDLPADELRSPIYSGLRAYQRAADDVRADDLRDRVVQANGQVGRLNGLLDNLLDVSRISAGSLRRAISNVGRLSWPLPGV